MTNETHDPPVPEPGPAEATGFFGHVVRTYLRSDPVILLTRDGPGGPGEINLDRMTLASAIERRRLSRIDLIRLDLSQTAPEPVMQLAAAATREEALAFVDFDAVPTEAGRAAIAERLIAGFGAVYGFENGVVHRLDGTAAIAAREEGVLCVPGNGMLEPAVLVLDAPLSPEPPLVAVAPVAPLVTAEPLVLPRLALDPEDRMLGAPLRSASGWSREPAPPRNRGLMGFVIDLFWLLVAVAAALLAEGAATLSYKQPLALAGDHLRFVAAARALIDSTDLWRNPFLGFPNGPLPYDGGLHALLPRAFLLLLGQGGVGDFAVAKLFMLGAIAATVGGAYLALRALGIRSFVGAAAAVAFTVSPYAATLAFGREFQAFSVAVPLGVLLAFFVAGKVGVVAGPVSRGGQGLLACLAVLVVGLSGVPSAALTALFVLAAGLAAMISQRRPLRFFATVAVLASLGGLVLMGWFGRRLPTVLAELPHFAAAAPDRLGGGLSLADMLLTVPRFRSLNGQIIDFAATLPLLGTGEGRGLWPGAALTLLILLAPFIVLIRLTAPAERQARLLGIGGLAAALTALGLLLFVRGGAGFVIPDEAAGAIGSVENLIPFLAFFATIVAGRLAERCFATERVLPGVVGVAIPLLLLIALVPAAGTLQREQGRTLGAPGYPETVLSLEVLLAQKDAVGLTTILQLPIEPLPPRSGRPSPVGNRQLLPFLFDRAHPPARWSGGLTNDQPGLPDFRAAIHPAIDPAGLGPRAKTLGFDGILVDKKAVTAEAAAGLAAGLRPDCLVYDDGSWSLFRLTGKVAGQSCLVDPAPPPLASYAIDLRASASAAAEVLGDGWVGKPGPAGVAAAGTESTLLLPVPGGEGDITVTLTMSPPEGTPRRLSITLDGKQLGQTVTIGSEGGGSQGGGYQGGGDVYSLPLPLPRPSLGGGPFFRLGLQGAAPAGQKPMSLLAVKVEIGGPR